MSSLIRSVKSSGREQSYMSTSSGNEATQSPTPPQYQMPPQYQTPGGPAPQAYPPGYWQPGAYVQVQPRRVTDGLAIASMVLGILWVGWIGSILAVIFGHVALRRIAREGKAGRGMAIAGLVLGYVGVATLLLYIVVVVIAFNSGPSA
jgi:hypothetical protein